MLTIQVSDLNMELNTLAFDQIFFSLKVLHSSESLVIPLIEIFRIFPIFSI